jgi:hypothetical protein
VIRCPTLQVSQFLFPGQRSDTFLTDHVNIWLLQLVGFFLSLHALLLTTHGHRNLKLAVFIFAFCTSNFVFKIFFPFQNRYFKILSAFYSVSDVSKEDKWWGEKHSFYSEKTLSQCILV